MHALGIICASRASRAEPETIEVQLTCSASSRDGGVVDDRAIRIVQRIASIIAKPCLRIALRLFAIENTTLTIGVNQAKVDSTCRRSVSTHVVAARSRESALKWTITAFKVPIDLTTALRLYSSIFATSRKEAVKEAEGWFERSWLERNAGFRKLWPGYVAHPRAGISQLRQKGETAAIPHDLAYVGTFFRNETKVVREVDGKHRRIIVV